MNKSRTYLLNLSFKEKQTLAKKIKPEAKAFYQYLYQIGTGYRTPSRRMAAILEKSTNGKIKSKDFEKEALKKVSVK